MKYALLLLKQDRQAALLSLQILNAIINLNMVTGVGRQDIMCLIRCLLTQLLGIIQL